LVRTIFSALAPRNNKYEEVSARRSIAGKIQGCHGQWWKSRRWCRGKAAESPVEERRF